MGTLAKASIRHACILRFWNVNKSHQFEKEPIKKAEKRNHYERANSRK